MKLIKKEVKIIIAANGKQCKVSNNKLVDTILYRIQSFLMQNRKMLFTTDAFILDDMQHITWTKKTSVIGQTMF